MTINLVDISGKPVDLIAETIAVLSGEIHVMSGSISVDSGLHVLVSGQPVTISGDHVFVESGVWIAGMSFSGLDIQVNISGDPVIISGQPVTISGDHVYVESGARVVTTFASGQGVSGAHVIISGQPVIISGQPVIISGQHVHLESGDTINVYAISGSEVRLSPESDVRIIDRSGHYAYVGKRHEGLVTEGFAVNEVHKGEMYRVCTVISGLAAGGHAEMLISPASGYELHLMFSAGAEALAHVRLWENVQFTASGTAMTPNCLNRFTSGQPNSVFALTPTITDHGNMLYCDVIGAVGKFGGQAGVSRTNIPWVLQNVSGMLHSQSGVAGLWYLFELINQDADPADSSISIEFSEEEPI